MRPKSFFGSQEPLGAFLGDWEASEVDFFTDSYRFYWFSVGKKPKTSGKHLDKAAIKIAGSSHKFFYQSSNGLIAKNYFLDGVQTSKTWQNQDNQQNFRDMPDRLDS